MTTVDATGIAIRHGLGGKSQPIVNTAILGAFSAYSGLVRLDTVIDAIREEVPMQIDENIAAATEAVHAVRRMKEVAHV